MTAKEKINRGVKGRNIPSGVVKWLVEVVNQREEVVCVATILTLVAKKSPFIELNRRNIQKLLNGLTENTKPNWGKMTAQQMLEHLETTLLYSIGEPEAEKCFTPEEHLEKYQDSLYNHRKMPKDFPAPFLPEDGTLPELKYKKSGANQREIFRKSSEISDLL